MPCYVRGVSVVISSLQHKRCSHMRCGTRFPFTTKEFGSKRDLPAVLVISRALSSIDSQLEPFQRSVAKGSCCLALSLLPGIFPQWIEFCVIDTNQFCVYLNKPTCLSWSLLRLRLTSFSYTCTCPAEQRHSVLAGNPQCKLSANCARMEDFDNLIRAHLPQHEKFPSCASVHHRFW